MSLAKSETNDDGQLPAGWRLTTGWHFTPVILTAAQSAAWRCLSKTRERERTFMRVPFGDFALYTVGRLR